MAESSVPLSALSENELEDYIRSKYKLSASESQHRPVLSQSATTIKRSMHFPRAPLPSRFSSIVHALPPRPTPSYVPVEKPRLQLPATLPDLPE